MEVITSWDDGSLQDLKMAQLLKKYELPAIFFIPTVCELSEKQIKELSEDFEIGGHTTTHPHDLKRLSDKDVYNEIKDNKDWLEGIIGKNVAWFCYPRGRYTDNTIVQIKMAGFKYARTTNIGHIGHSEHYRVHTAVHVHPNRKEFIGQSFFQYALKQYRMAISNDNSYYHIWGHSWEVEKYDLWEDLERLFKLMYEYRNKRSYNNSYQA